MESLFTFFKKNDIFQKIWKIFLKVVMTDDKSQIIDFEIEIRFWPIFIINTPFWLDMDFE